MDAVLVIDATAAAPTVVVATAGVEHVCGFTPDEVLDRPWPPLWDPTAEAEALAVLIAAARAGAPVRVPLRTLCRDGDTVSCELDAVPAQASDGRPLAVCSLLPDGHRSEVDWLAYHDPLTGLTNRHLLERDLDLALSRATRTGLSVAVLFLDLDGFKDVNDSLGHRAGDDVLREVARRLRCVVRAHDLLARLGGDEFALVLCDLPDTPAARARRALDHVTEVVRRPIPVDGTDCRIGVSVGISVFPQDAQEREPLLAAADARMYQAKRELRD